MFHVNSLNYVVYRLQVQGMSVNSKRQTTPLPALDTTALQLSIVDAAPVGREITWELSCPLARQSLIDKAEAARLSNA